MPVTVDAPAPVKVTVWSGAVLAIIDPEVIEMPVLFVYVLIAGELIVKLGYVPVTVEAPAPVKVTVWSGAVLAIIDPEVIEMPELFV